MPIDKKPRVQGSNDEERLPSGAIGRHARTSRSSTHVTEGKCPRSRSPTPPPRARFSSPSTCAIDAVFTTSRPRDGVTGSNGSSVAIGRSEVWMGGRSTSHYSRNRGEAQSFEDSLSQRSMDTTTERPNRRRDRRRRRDARTARATRLTGIT